MYWRKKIIPQDFFPACIGFVPGGKSAESWTFQNSALQKEASWGGLAEMTLEWERKCSSLVMT